MRMFDPLEWGYVMALARGVLPWLNYRRDEEAAALASEVCGHDIDTLAKYDWSRPAIYMPPFSKVVQGTVVVAVEGYTAGRLVSMGVRPHVVVTDLDFEPGNVALGEVAVVHCHGDNMDAVRRLAPAIPRRVMTVQTWPRHCTFNVAGFTDGDRALYLALYMGAEGAVVSGFYPWLTVKRDDETKRRKLMVARHLIARLGRYMDLDFV